MKVLNGLVERMNNLKSVKEKKAREQKEREERLRQEAVERSRREAKAQREAKTKKAAKAAAAKKAAAKKAATAEAAGTGIGTTTEQDLLLISKATSFQQQLRLFFYRSMYLLKKSTGTADIFLVSFVATLSAVSCAKLIQKFGVNLVAASLANQAVALGASMVAVVMAIPEFETERLMFERERNVGLNV